MQMLILTNMNCTITWVILDIKMFMVFLFMLNDINPTDYLYSSNPMLSHDVFQCYKKYE